MATVVVAPLGGIQCDGIVRLADDLTIEPLPAHMLPVIQQARDSYIIRHPPHFGHCLVLERSSLHRDSDNDVKAFVERLVLLLRLYKPGNVYFNFAVIDENGWYRAPTVAVNIVLGQIGVFFYVGWTHRGLGDTFRLSTADSEPLATFVAAHRGADLMKNRSFRYFFRGFHEPYSEDRFLSNVIGLENVLCNDSQDHSNLKYKFVDRGCYLLHQARPHPDGAGGYVKPLGDIYDARSRIVHSAQKDIDWAEASAQSMLQNSEVFLRAVLNLVLQNPGFETAHGIDDAKRRRYA